MTPEEQFFKINNTLNHVAENLARLDANVERHEAEIKMTMAGIRDLVVVSRTLIDSQKATDGTLAALANTVDRLGVRLDEGEQARQRSNENFDVMFAALIQAQQETERKLQEWIARQNNGRGEGGIVSTS